MIPILPEFGFKALIQMHLSIAYPGAKGSGQLCLILLIEPHPQHH